MQLAVGVFKRRSAVEEKQLIEDLAKCNMKAPSESSGSNNRTKGSGVIELNKMTAMEAKLDAIMHKLGNQEKEANYLNEQKSYHFKPNPNLPTHYTPALRGHENFSYGGGVSQGPRHGQGFQQGYNLLRFQQQQQQGENKNEYQG